MIATTKSLLPLFLAEFIGTALLLLAGLSFVILNWGEGSIVAQLIPSEPVRRAVTGFLFGCTGCAITISKVGKVSGAHINPAVSVAFWLRGKMKTKAMLGYVTSQMLGAVTGCIPLLLWGKQGHSVQYGTTTAGAGGLQGAFIGEMITTACLNVLIFCFSGSKSLRNYTPYTMPLLYGTMVWLEAPYSGCSTNPARSFGPAVISGVYADYWLFVVAPLLAVAIVVFVFRLTKLHHYYHLKTARVSYHNRLTHESLRTSSVGKPEVAS